MANLLILFLIGNRKESDILKVIGILLEKMVQLG